jgi:hypothetical protein
MQTFAWFAAAIALLALAALAVRLIMLVARVHALVDKVGGLVENDVASTVRAMGDTARGAQQAIGKLDKGLDSLATSLERVDRITQKLEPESLARTVMQPAVAKVTSWVAGLRRGLSSVLTRGKGQTKEGGEGTETEVG